jgi:hypothetical protein
MKFSRIVPIAAALLGLMLLPLTAALVLILQAKGALSLTWPTINLGSLDLGALLPSLGTEMSNLPSHDLASRLMDSSGRAGQTSSPGGVAGGSGAAGGGSIPSRDVDPFTRGYVRWWEEHLEPLGDAVDWLEQMYREGEQMYNDAVDSLGDMYNDAADSLGETWDSLFGSSSGGSGSGSP